MENKNPLVEPQTPAKTIPPEPPKMALNPRSKWPFVLLGLVLIVILLSGAYVLGKNQNVNQKPTSKTPVTTQTATSTPTPTPDLTTTWRTYTDPNGVYSLKYPATWNNPVYDYPITKESGKPVKLVSDARPPFAIVVRTFEGFGNFTAEQFVTDYFYVYSKDANGNDLDPELKYLSIEEKNINGNKVSIIKGLQAIPGRRGPTAWLTHESTGIFIETNSLDNPQEKDQATLEQILSTFKFAQ
jgi:hypothetical protein